jgi:hypothetical protein
MADPAAAGGDTDADTSPVFERTADDIEIRIGSLIAQMTAEPKERRAS